jgi:dCMP deaminase
MKAKFIDFYLDAATKAATLSHARRLKVGAVLVQKDSIISYGYNGTPAGFDNNCEDPVFSEELDINGKRVVVNTGNLATKPEVIHAEMNAIGKAAEDGYKCGGASMFLTHAPCIECAKLIWRSGINEVYYRDTYRSNAGLEFLSKAKVKTHKV